MGLRARVVKGTNNLGNEELRVEANEQLGQMIWEMRS